MRSQQTNWLGQRPSGLRLLPKLFSSVLSGFEIQTLCKPHPHGVHLSNGNSICNSITRCVNNEYFTVGETELRLALFVTLQSIWLAGSSCVTAWYGIPPNFPPYFPFRSLYLFYFFAVPFSIPSCNPITKGQYKCKCNAVTDNQYKYKCSTIYNDITK